MTFPNYAPGYRPEEQFRALPAAVSSHPSASVATAGSSNAPSPGLADTAHWSDATTGTDIPLGLIGQIIQGEIVSNSAGSASGGASVEARVYLKA